MKTLYININNEQIQSNEELEVLNYDLDSDFFFYLGEKIAKGSKIENENALITDFNTKDNEEDYKQIITQWNEIKAILFSEECEGKIEFTLPNGYIHWLRYSEKYNHVYHKNFSYGEPSVISIDLEELYEESVEEMQRKMLRKLRRDDLYIEIDEIVFNDDAVTCKSPIVRAIKEKYNSAGFISYKKWIREKGEYYTELINNSVDNNERLIWPIELSNINLSNVIKAGYTPMSVIGHDDKNYILLASIDDRDCVVDTKGRFLYKFIYGHAISTKTGKFIIVKRFGTECRYYGLIKADDGKELLPCTYHGTDSICEKAPGFFSSIKIGTYCATLESYCEYIDENIFFERKHWKLHSFLTGNYIDFKEEFNLKVSLLGSWRFEFKSFIYVITYSPPIGSDDNKFSILINSKADKYHILKTDEFLDSVSNNGIVIKQFGEVSTILDNSFQEIFNTDYVLANDEVVRSVSEGMTIISNKNSISRILDEKFNNIINKITYVSPNYSVLQSLTSYTSLEFKYGIALFHISNKLIGCIDKKGNIIQIPWNFGKRISSFEVLLPNLIVVRKTSEEWYIINLKGENVIPTRRWDNIRIVSDSQIEIYNSSSSKLYKIQDNNIKEVL